MYQRIFKAFKHFYLHLYAEPIADLARCCPLTLGLGLHGKTDKFMWCQYYFYDARVYEGRHVRRQSI